MAKSLVYKRNRPAGEVSFNMTPMIDCTFLLIVFFILASQMASKALSQLQLHRPHMSQAVLPERPPERVIVNVVTQTQGAEGDLDASQTAQLSHYEIDGVPIDLRQTDLLTEEFRRRRARAGDAEFFVEIRADARAAYGDVYPVMDAAAEAGIARMNITALLEAGQ